MSLFPRARKRFGQHFLEPAWVARLVDLVEPRADETFLEIGPGRGALTARLAPRVGHLVCVEVDRDLAAALRASVPANVTVVEADVLRVDIAALLEPSALPARAIGNLPYNISSPILFLLLAAAADGRVLRAATLMLQQEVAARLAARPGSREYGALAVQASRVADIDILLTLPPGAFRPPPKVTSAVVRLRFRPPAVDVGDPVVFEQVVRGVFQHRRKQIGNGLASVAHARGHSAADVLRQADVEPGKRPEALTLEEFARLARAVL